MFHADFADKHTKSMIHFNLILICLNENGVNYLKPAGDN